MKKTILMIAIVCFFTAELLAQNNIEKGSDVKTLFDNNGSFGGFLKLNTKVGDMNSQSSLLVGGAISGVFSSKVNLGLAGYGLTTNVNADTYDDDGYLLNINMGYGGLLIEPVIGNRKVVHITVPMLLGVGGAGLKEDISNKRPIRNPDREERLFREYDSDVFLVAEPGLMLELNLLRNVRLDLGATYRYVYDVNLEGLSDEELSGFTASVGLKFGWF